uniref:Uncharacterized protein n=1 Tax=Haematobia irritans TaxID=7368 RepID=A0A1L8E9T3_HAEIR
MATIPNITKTTMQTNKTPPHIVKSYLVWKAKSVRAKQTAAVIPTAIRISMGANRLADMANKNDSAKVKSPKNIKFMGVLRRTPSQQAIEIIVTKRTAKAIQNRDGWRMAYCLDGSCKANNATNPKVTKS